MKTEFKKKSIRKVLKKGLSEEQYNDMLTTISDEVLDIEVSSRKEFVTAMLKKWAEGHPLKLLGLAMIDKEIFGMEHIKSENDNTIGANILQGGGGFIVGFPDFPHGPSEAEVLLSKIEFIRGTGDVWIREIYGFQEGNPSMRVLIYPKTESSLQEQLDKAIAEDNFERAAELRDEIKEEKGKKSEGKKKTDED